jgi:uncharacterized protein YbjT (DUF2867 family)
MILVTGATGKNGVEIIRRLSGRKERVRAMVHRQNDILRGTPNVELEYVEADFDDPASLRKVLSGVQRAFLVTNSSEHVEERQLRFVALAREAGVKHIVYLSQLHAASDSPLRFLRYHAAVEEALRALGMSYINLRPNLYMQGLLMIGRTIASEGRFFASGRRAGECSRRPRHSRGSSDGADQERARRKNLRHPRTGSTHACRDGGATV